MKIKKDIIANSKTLKAMSDPVRLFVIQQLFERDTYVSELIKAIKIESTLLSHHLSVLRKAGLVIFKREGKTLLYKINPEVRIRGKNSGLNLGFAKVTFK